MTLTSAYSAYFGNGVDWYLNAILEECIMKGIKGFLIYKVDQCADLIVDMYYIM